MQPVLNPKDVEQPIKISENKKIKCGQYLEIPIAIGRATIMEGSFGNEKNHYGLQKVNARTEKTEITWIFFGIMTANAIKIAKKIKKFKKQQT